MYLHSKQFVCCRNQKTFTQDALKVLYLHGNGSFLLQCGILSLSQQLDRRFEQEAFFWILKHIKIWTECVPFANASGWTGSSGHTTAGFYMIQNHISLLLGLVHPLSFVLPAQPNMTRTAPTPRWSRPSASSATRSAGGFTRYVDG